MSEGGELVRLEERVRRMLEDGYNLSHTLYQSRGLVKDLGIDDARKELKTFLQFMEKVRERVMERALRKGER